MSKRLVFELNRAGVAELMKSKNMQKVLEHYATRIRRKAGDGYGQDMYIGRNRANASIFPKTKEAQRDNSKNNTLLKSVR